MARVARFLALLWLAAILPGCKLPAVSAPGQLPTDPARQRLVSDLVRRSPEGGSVSIQPNLLSYLGTKASPYLFPVTGDAEYVLADVAASPDPIVIKGLYLKVHELLDSGQYGVVEASDGLALLQKGLAGQSRLPNGFYDFLRARPNEEAFPLQARFGDGLEMVAYDYRTSGEDLVNLTTFWRAVRPLDGEYRLVFLLAPILGLQPDAYEDGSPASLWYPPKEWQSGEVIKVELAPAVFSRGTRTVQASVYRQTGPNSRVALSGVISGEANLDGVVRVVDLANPPGRKVPLSSFLGLPFEAAPASGAGALLAPARRSNPVAFSLCGKPLDDASLARLRPVAVKIDNAPAARPQVGLDQACVVYEHMAEGGITRFTAIYHTEETEVGPVRSARRIDLHIVPQYQALFAHVGGAPAEMAAIRASKLLDVDQFFNAESYYFTRQRPAPSNVYTTISNIRARADALGYGREATLEGFPLSEKPPEGGRPATQIIVPYHPTSQGEFRYDPQAGDYLRYTAGRPHVDQATGQIIRASTVIVQKAPSWIASYTEDAGGAPTLDFDLVGEGPATVFRDGMAFDGKWVRTSLGGWTRFYDETGQVIPLAPGKIWISVVSLEERATVR